MICNTSTNDGFGVWPVMLTPFDTERAIDWDAIDPLIEWYLSAGAAGLFACCQSSEVFTLTEPEKVALARHIVSSVAGRVPVVAGAMGQKDVEARLQVSRQYDEAGVDVVVLSPNEFGDAHADEKLIVDRLITFAEESDPIALGLYECPLPYHRVLSAEAVRELAATGRFVWMKETSADLEMIRSKLAAARRTSLRIYNANTDRIVDAVRLGCDGYSGLAGNFVLRDCVDLCHAARAGRLSEQTADMLDHLQAMNSRQIKIDYPTSAKAYLRDAGLPLQPFCRTTERKAYSSTRPVDAVQLK